MLLLRGLCNHVKEWILCFFREMRPRTHTLQEKQLRHCDILGPYMMGFHETYFMFIIFRDYL